MVRLSFFRMMRSRQLPVWRTCDINPTFYLIIWLKLAGGNSKKWALDAAFCLNFNGTSALFTNIETFCRRPVRALSMSLDLSDVKRLAVLAQLELTPGQADQTLDKLNGIFALVEQMRAVDTTGVLPLNHPIAAIRPDLGLRLREDVVTEPNRREDYQKNAPATQDGLYLVPKVID